MVYQTVHLSVGFIGEPIGHPKASAKSFEFDKGPTTRMGPGG